MVDTFPEVKGVMFKLRVMILGGYYDSPFGEPLLSKVLGFNGWDHRGSVEGVRLSMNGALSFLIFKYLNGTYPNSGFGEVGPHGDLLPSAHVRIPVPGESGLELLELLRSEVSSLPSLPLGALAVLSSHPRAAFLALVHLLRLYAHAFHPT